ncbi:hypothetical protein KKF91_22350 [Myxococcota bacterium]|nr:hypothetical protein [Myxococcota bacterium]MBU1433282.1 hypothetical protein [Myxococcota bacterium]MBU1899006.1 hypothetical protein [Myxococcota bacterium]
MISLLLSAALSLAAPMVLADAEELEALRALEDDKLITARERATAILKARRSMVATYVMGYVHFIGEGNFPRARFLFDAAKRALLARYGDPPQDPDARAWHRQILRDQRWLMGNMDLREAELAIIDEHDREYTPKLDAWRIWPLIKLGRFEEARAIGLRLKEAEDEVDRLKAYNGLLTIEDELRHRQGSWDWSTRAVEATQGRSCVILENTGLSARRVLNIEQIEPLQQRAIKAEERDCPNSPYLGLSTAHLIAGRFQPSIAAMKEVRAEPRSGQARMQNEMQIRGRFVEILYALGQLGPALERAEEIIDWPDRKGTSSISQETQMLSDLLLHAAVIEARLIELRERFAARGLVQSVALYQEAQALLVSRWEKRRMAHRLAADPTRFLDLMRPYWTDVVPWYAGISLDVFGLGATRAALAAARAVDDEPIPRLRAYYDALEAELLWREGALAAAERKIEAALAEIPELDALLRLRLLALGVDAARRLRGEVDEAAWHALLTGWPTALRILDVALPAHVTHDGAPLSAAIAARLGASPRLTRGPFEVAVGQIEGRTRLCVRAPGGFQYSCAEVTAEINAQAADDEARIIAAIDAFHAEALAPKVELTQRDINSLDGSPIRVDAKQAISELLGDTP